MSFDNRNTWILSKNDKGNNPKRPDYRGTVNIDGRDFELSGWIRTKKSDGSKFISGAVKPKEPKADPGAYQPQEAPKQAAPTTSNAAGDDEDVPF